MAPGKHRSRIRCLALARIFAASMVALAFAATIVAVVFTAGLAPDSVRLSVTHGHIQSAELLWKRYDWKIFSLRTKRIETQVIYAPDKQLTLRVSLDAHDPTRRAAKVCVDAVRVFDMPNAPSFDGMVEIAAINNTVATGKDDQPCKPWRHNRSDTMELDRWITIATNDSNPLMLCYISQKYGGVSDFTAMLKVEMKILYPHEGDTYKPDTHYCWPVTIGNSRSTSSQPVTCKLSNAINYTSDASVLSPRTFTTRQQLNCIQYGENFPQNIFD